MWTSFLYLQVKLLISNFIKVNLQQDLLKVFSKLYKDLSNRIMNTFDDNVVHYPHINVLNRILSCVVKFLTRCVVCGQVFNHQTE